MESTTLVTFMLNHPTARFVELRGSWDNFAEPWQMSRDSRRGAGHWTGCHKFRNIICDGDSTGFHERRDGGLKMGGTYWYYYRIDGDDEYHDPSQPSTSNSPLLPGQYVNVLEVPWEAKFTSRSRSSSVTLITEFHTLNPDDRYKNPRPAPKPRLPKLMTKLEPQDFRSWSAAPPESASVMVDPRPIKSASNIPVNAFVTALERAEQPVITTRVECVSSRGRLRLRPSLPQLRPTHKTNTAETSPVRKGDISHPIPQTGVSDYTESFLIPITKRLDPYEKTVKLLQEGEMLSSAVERLPDPFWDGPTRTMTAPQTSRQPFTIHHRRAVSYESALHRASSMSDLRQAYKEASTSPEVIIDTTNHIINIPAAITEVDTPPRIARKPVPARKPAPVVAGLNLTGLDLPSFASHSSNSLSHGSSRSITPTSSRPDLNKELPALPAFLVPSPLFSPHHPLDTAIGSPMHLDSPGESAHEVLPDPQSARPSDFVANWTYQQSRFSNWTMDAGLSPLASPVLSSPSLHDSASPSTTTAAAAAPGLLYMDPFLSSSTTQTYSSDDDDNNNTLEHSPASSPLSFADSFWASMSARDSLLDAYAFANAGYDDFAAAAAAAADTAKYRDDSGLDILDARDVVTAHGHGGFETVAIVNNDDDGSSAHGYFHSRHSSGSSGDEDSEHQHDTFATNLQKALGALNANGSATTVVRAAEMEGKREAAGGLGGLIDEFDYLGVALS